MSTWSVVGSWETFFIQIKNQHFLVKEQCILLLCEYHTGSSEQAQGKESISSDPDIACQYLSATPQADYSALLNTISAGRNSRVEAFWTLSGLPGKLRQLADHLL